MKKSIYDLAINRYDTQIALVENQGMFNSVQESVVRVYDVGRRRDDEDEQVRKPTDFTQEIALLTTERNTNDLINFIRTLILPLEY